MEECIYCSAETKLSGERCPGMLGVFEGFGGRTQTTVPARSSTKAESSEWGNTLTQNPSKTQLFN
jgi:hypothetical protein